MTRAKETKSRENPNKGIWKSFFRMCLRAKLPIMTIIVYCLIRIFNSQIYLLVPSKTGELFAGNVSVQMVTIVIVSQILTSTLKAQNLHCGHRAWRASSVLYRVYYS